jgi:hypothetical protein
MGQAKQRGTFEQRKDSAVDVIEKNYIAAKDANEKLDAEEGAATKLMGMLVEDTLERFSKSGHVLLNADFSQLESQMFSRRHTTAQEAYSGFVANSGIGDGK